MFRLVNRRSLAGLLYVPAAAAGGLISSTAVLANLPATGSGMFFLCQGMLPFVLLFDLGLLISGTREIAFSAGRERAAARGHGAPDGVLPTFLRFRNARLATLALISLTGIATVLPVMLWQGVRDNSNIQALILCTIAAMLVLTSYVYQSYLEGTGNYHLDRFASTATVLISGGLIAGSAVLTRSLWCVVAAWYLGQSLTVAVKATLAHRLDRRVHTFPRGGLSDISPTFRQSFSIFLIQLGAAVTKYVQYPIITAVLGVSVLGTYFFVVRVASTVDQAISVLNASQRAIFSQLYAGRRFREARKLMLTILTQVLSLTLLGAAAIIFILPSAVRIFTHHLGVSNVPFWVIGLDLISMCTSGMMTQFVIASGRNPFPKAVLAAGVLTVVLLVYLVPRYGLLGAALGQFIANAATNLGYSAWHFRRLSRDLLALAESEPTHG